MQELLLFFHLKSNYNELLLLEYVLKLFPGISKNGGRWWRDWWYTEDSKCTLTDFLAKAHLLDCDIAFLPHSWRIGWIYKQITQTMCFTLVWSIWVIYKNAEMRFFLQLDSGYHWDWRSADTHPEFEWGDALHRPTPQVLHQLPVALRYVPLHPQGVSPARPNRSHVTLLLQSVRYNYVCVCVHQTTHQLRTEVHHKWWNAPQNFILENKDIEYWKVSQLRSITESISLARHWLWCYFGKWWHYIWSKIITISTGYSKKYTKRKTLTGTVKNC